jgi:hypothetical protein
MYLLKSVLCIDICVFCSIHQCAEYGIVGEVMFWTLAKVIGQGYTSKVHEAWVKIFSSLLRVIMPIAVHHELQDDTAQRTRLNALHKKEFGGVYTCEFKDCEPFAEVGDGFDKSHEVCPYVNKRASYEGVVTDRTRHLHSKQNPHSHQQRNHHQHGDYLQPEGDDENNSAVLVREGSWT